MITSESISILSRRAWLRTSALFFGTSLIDIKTADAFSLSTAKAPALTAAEITAIETDMGKKEHTKILKRFILRHYPRNDLKITVKGESVPIPFGFGGWVGIKRTLDGKSAVSVLKLSSFKLKHAMLYK